MNPLLLFLICFLLIHCGPKHGGVSSSHAGHKGSSVQDTEEEMSPERQASNHLVDQAKLTMEQEDWDRAEDLLRESIQVDGENGAAYYSLSLVKIQLEAWNEANGLFEKAQQLLQGQEGWEELLEELKQKLSENSH